MGIRKVKGYQDFDDKLNQVEPEMIEVVEFTRIEHQQVNVHITMQVTSEVLMDEFNFTPERFEEVISHVDEGWSANPKGKAPDQEEIDRFHEVYWESDRLDSHEDWISDRKGGYDVSYEVIEEKSTLEKVLHENNN